MNKDKFLYFLKNPGQLDNESLPAIAEIVGVFPFFQTAHLLYVKNLHNLENIKYNNQLKLSSAYITDRKILYQLIFSKTLEKANEAKNAPVVDEPVTLDYPKLEIPAPPEVAPTRVLSAPVEPVPLPVYIEEIPQSESEVIAPGITETDIEKEIITNVTVQAEELVINETKEEPISLDLPVVEGQKEIVGGQNEDMPDIHIMEEQTDESVETISSKEDYITKDEIVVINPEPEIRLPDTKPELPDQQTVPEKREEPVVSSRKSFLSPDKETVADRILRELREKREIMAFEKAKKKAALMEVTDTVKPEIPLQQEIQDETVPDFIPEPVEESINFPVMADGHDEPENHIVEAGSLNEAQAPGLSDEGTGLPGLMTETVDSEIQETDTVPLDKIDEVPVVIPVEEIPVPADEIGSFSDFSPAQEMQQADDYIVPAEQESVADIILRQVKERREKLLKIPVPVEPGLPVEQTVPVAASCDESIIMPDTENPVQEMAPVDIQERVTLSGSEIPGQNDESALKEKELLLNTFKLDEFPVYNSLRFEKRKNLPQDENRESIADKILKQVNKFRVERIEKSRQLAKESRTSQEDFKESINDAPEIIAEVPFLVPLADEDMMLPDDIQTRTLAVDEDTVIEPPVTFEEKDDSGIPVPQADVCARETEEKGHLVPDIDAIKAAFSEIVSTRLDMIVDEKLEKFNTASKSNFQALLFSMKCELDKITESVNEMVDQPGSATVEFDFTEEIPDIDFIEETDDESESEAMFEYGKSMPSDYFRQEPKTEKEEVVLPVIESTASKYSNLNSSLIEKFLRGEHKISPAEPTLNIKEVSKLSIEENEECISETLAKIYMKQAHYSKALLAYRKLSLKYPEKSIYFAAQIEKIKKITNE